MERGDKGDLDRWCGGNGGLRDSGRSLWSWDAPAHPSSLRQRLCIQDFSVTETAILLFSQGPAGSEALLKRGAMVREQQS